VAYGKLAAFPRSEMGLVEMEDNIHSKEKNQTCLRKRVKERRFPYIRETCDRTLRLRGKERISQNKPTMPIFKLLPGRPRRTFFSGAAFFGGIFFFAARVADVEKRTMR
jgi:hypothetical protein